MNKTISIILLNWNGNNYIHDCIASVKKQSYKNIEAILVDNGSTDGSIEQIIKNHPEFIYVLHKSNQGFAKGMNSGIETACGDYLLLLNLDVYLKEDYIEKCLQRIETDNDIGCIAGPEFAWMDGKLTDNHLSSSGAMFLRKRIQIAYNNEKSVEQFCFGVTGSFPLFRREALQDIFSVSGYYFDPDFETGWEDTDMRFRLFWRGWKTLYYPGAIAWHVGSASDKGNKRLIDKNISYQQRIFRNRYYVIIKNIPKQLKSYFWLKLFLTETLIYPYYLILSPRSLVALFKAKKEVKRNRLSLIEKRERIQKNLKVPVEILKNYIIGF